jgi:hypothetical protein
LGSTKVDFVGPSTFSPADELTAFQQAGAQHLGVGFEDVHCD